MWVAAFSFLAIGTFTAWRLIKDPIQGQTIWKGTCSQSSMRPYEMIMKIDERKGNEITGTLEWPIVKCRTQFQGFIIDKNISFTESAVIEGRGIVVPTVYLGKVDKETIAGTWLHEEKNSVASGEFRVIKSCCNGADARQEEKKTNIRAAELTPAMKLLSDANKKASTDLSQANNGLRISVDVPVLRPDETYSDELLKKAEAGDVNAQSDLARCLFKGEGIIKNEKEGFTWARKGAEQGNASAQFMLGSRLTEGFGIAKNEKEGLMWLSKSAKQGNAKGQYSLGRCYMMGIGVEKNLREAFKWFTKSAEQGDMNGQYALGQLYAYGYGVKKDEKKAYEYFLKVAAQTNEASVDLTPDMRAQIDAYKLAYAVPSPDKKNRSAYSKSPNQTNTNSAELTPALKLLSDANKRAYAENYQPNNVPSVSVDEPILRPDQTFSDELQKKAESGDSTAQRHLGSCYYRGLGIKKNISKAIEQWEKAAYQGDVPAQCNLGSIYYLEQRKYDKAFAWFKKASDSGDAYAINNLGTLYNYGLGVEKNEKEGFRLHKIAAELKEPCALYNLAADYETGRGTEKDMQMAIKVYSQAASAGNSEAQYDLGLRYFDGRGVPQNTQKALELFTMAAAKNHQKAKDMLPVLKTLVKQQSSTNPQQNP